MDPAGSVACWQCTRVPGGRRQPANQGQRQLVGRKVTGQHHRHVGNQHAQGCADNHQPQIRVLSGQHYGRHLGLIADFSDEKRNQCGQERAKFAGRARFVIVHFVWHQRPQCGGRKAGCEDPVQGHIREETAEPGTYRTCGGVVGQGRGHDAGNDWPRLAKAGGENEGEQLRLVADFGQGNDCSRNE